MRIELLSAPGCPHAAAAQETITDCLTALRIDMPIIDRVGRYPSPTVLVDGVDRLAGEREPKRRHHRVDPGYQRDDRSCITHVGLCHRQSRSGQRKLAWTAGHREDLVPGVEGDWVASRPVCPFAPKIAKCMTPPIDH